jgi:hypothetical protein
VVKKQNDKIGFLGFKLYKPTNMYIQIRYLVLSVFFMSSFCSISQTICEKTYPSSEVDIPAELPMSPNDFVKFINNEIAPILSKNETYVTKLVVLFTISNEGDITTVEFPNLEAPVKVHNDLAKAFMKLGKWEPAELENKKVCSEFTYPIACLKWQ